MKDSIFNTLKIGKAPGNQNGSIANQLTSLVAKEKKDRILNFCEVIIKNVQHPLQQLHRNDEEHAFRHNLISFMETLDFQQLEFFQGFILSLVCESSEEGPAKNQSESCFSEKNSEISEEEKTHREIVNYQKQYGCRYDQAAAEVFRQDLQK